MGVRDSDGSTGWLARGGQGGMGGRAVGKGRVRPPALRPARYTCSGTRSWSRLGSLCRGDTGRVTRARGIRGAEVAQHVLQALVAQHRALEASRADLDAQEVEQVVRADRRDVCEGLALDLVGQEAGARLADG